MGLILLPFFSDDTDQAPFALDVIHVELNGGYRSGAGLADMIYCLPSNDAPVGFRCRLAVHEGTTKCFYEGDSIFGVTEVDSFGEPLSWVRAGDLAELSDHPQVTCFPRNKAAFSYISALPVDWPVVLFWS